MLLNMYLWTKAPRKKLLGILRVSAYAVTLSLIAGAFTVHTAVAGVEDEGLQLGRQLAEVGDLLGDANEFRLNGQSVYFATQTTDESVKQVLDRFEDNCNKAKAFEPIESRGPDGKVKPVLPQDSGWSRFGVMRREDPDAGDGIVMCFTSDGGGTKRFLVGLRQFYKSGDLHDLGNLRYVHVYKRTRVTKQDMAQAPTLVQTMWTDGTFNIRTIIGKPGEDSVGSDFATLPRPIDSTRRLTAEAVRTPYAARIYMSKASPEAVLGDYQSKMLGAGWLSIKPPVAVKYGGDGDGRWFSKPDTGEQVAVSVRKEERGTAVVVGSLGLRDAPPTNPGSP